jgi:WD40-like Beta Propeller Repeat
LAKSFGLLRRSGANLLHCRSPPDASNPFWTANGRWIYFSREQSPAIWKVPADGGNAVRLTDTDGFNPQESADGAAHPATLNLFDPNNRHVTRVAALSGLFWGWGPGLNISYDGHTVLYGKDDGEAADIMLIEGFR